MRKLFALSLSLSCLASAAAAQPVANARVGTQVEWSYERQPRGATYRFGEITLEIRPVRDHGIIAPRVTVRRGRTSAVMTGSSVGPTFGHKLGVGLLDRRGTRFVYFQSFSGGAHCCNKVQVALVRPGGIRVVAFGNWDGEYWEMPRDEDGDGVVDFVMNDNAFLYAFASYADSYAPPVIFNIVGDRMTDVSARAGFRPLFQRTVNDARGLCARSADRNPNGVCAAYVAAAARIGQFGPAWTHMLRNYSRTADWELPVGCRISPDRNGGCPPRAEIRYTGYPDALRAFLVRQGYLAR